MAVNIEDLVQLLLAQEGDKYVFGHEASPDDNDPNIFDCSELIQWGCDRLGVTPKMPDGSWYQYRHCYDHGLDVTVSQGIHTRAALLFRFSSDPLHGGRPSSAHVAMSLGDGRTIEARGSRYGVGSFGAYGRGWTHAALIPGVNYQQEDPPMAVEDLTQPGELFAADWAEAQRLGIMQGNDPTNVVEKQELAAFIVRIFKVIGRELDTLRTDLGTLKVAINDLARGDDASQPENIAVLIRQVAALDDRLAPVERLAQSIRDL